MAEFYAVLKKAVSGIEPHSSDARRAIYDKARNALIGQLKAIDPPLSASEISRQRLELEESIRRVEREATSPPPAPPRPQPAPPPRQPPRYASQEPRYASQEQRFPAAPEPESRYAAPEPAPRFQDPRPGPAPRYSESAAPRQTPTFEPEVAHPAAHFEAPTPVATDFGLGQETFQRAVLDAERQGSRGSQPRMRAEPPVEPGARGTGGRTEPAFMRPPSAARPAAARPAPAQAYDLGADMGVPVDAAPRLAPEFDWGADQAKTNEPPVPMVDRPMAGEGSRAGRDRGSRRRQAPAEAANRSSRLPGILFLVLVVAVLGGIGALAWSFRDKLPIASSVIGDMIASFDQDGDGANPPDTVSSTGDGAVTATGGDDGVPAATAANVRRVDAPADDAGGPLSFAPDDAPLADGTAVAALMPPTDDPAQLAVAQKAILYEEHADAPEAQRISAISAAVTWSFVAGGPNGPAVVADIDVPERNLHIRISITKNLDAALPATHLIELQADVPTDFPGGGIQAIPRLVVKPTEEARGDPLVGDAQKVVDGLFWIALTSDPALADANLASLRDLDWFDLPLLYGDNQRAIMTFEKGVPGRRAFDQAFAAWATG